jgi:uncharacterized protein YjeT (DUF2065 family)
MNFDLIPRWDLVAMCVAMAILFVLEMLGVFGHPNVTITAIVRLTPRWMSGNGLGMARLAFPVGQMSDPSLSRQMAGRTGRTTWFFARRCAEGHASLH